ncbi:MAG: FAD-dependent oxidoreductase [Nocardiopsaceae bacterium]|nr:FAD-dependent oxidoreductase [Nocardiopsaceae bacterium]
MPQRYRAIVIGCGAIGAATAYWLSRRLGPGPGPVNTGPANTASASTGPASTGSVNPVLALEQYELGHTLGSSEDHSRVIRHTYDRADYTALTPAAYQSWNVAERETGLRFVHRTGGLMIAAPGNAGGRKYVEAAADALAAVGLPFEPLDGAAIRQRWPQWRLTDDHTAIFDPESGILDIRRATAAHLALARARGADIRPHTPVSAITESSGGVTVTAGGETYAADRLVLAGGAWNPALLRMLGTSLPITLTQEQITYFATPNVRDFTPERFTVWGVYADDGLAYYGIPVYGEVAVKAGLDGVGPVVTQQTRNQDPDPERTERTAEFLRGYLPGAVGPELYTRVCCYDCPPDRDFIADYVPGSDRVLVCAGAGHAGKFAALLGRVLADLAADGATAFPVGAFRADRAFRGGIPGRM